LAAALAMITTKVVSFLLNGPCENSFEHDSTDVDNLLYGVQVAEESMARNKGLHEDTQDIGDNGQEH